MTCFMEQGSGRLENRFQYLKFSYVDILAKGLFRAELSVLYVALQPMIAASLDI